MIHVTRGSSSKPTTSQALIEALSTVTLDGQLYIGYPIIGTPDGQFEIDALLVTKEKGLVAFILIEGKNVPENIEDLLDDAYMKLKAKLLQYKDLTIKRDLAVPVEVFAFSPAASLTTNTTNVFQKRAQLLGAIQNLESAPPELYLKTLSAIQAVSNIRKGKHRRALKKIDSRGTKMKDLEDSIANLDSQQSQAVIETCDGVQRIRGLAGSGKTIVLALKVAYIHAKHPDWKIAVTFNTRSLREHLRNLITNFILEHASREPDWDKIDLIHAWGNSKSAGIYSNLCSDLGIAFLDLSETRSRGAAAGSEFELACADAMKYASSISPKYDAIFIDEAQDFAPDFLRICYLLLKNPKRLVYAYDELQNLSGKSMLSPEDIFGRNPIGHPLVSLRNDADKPKQDIILEKCYRNPGPTLVTAHALGFGIYRNEGLIQMFDNPKLWLDIGYEIQDGDLRDGENVVLARTSKSSPDFLKSHSEIDDLIKFQCFASAEDQYDWLVNEIQKNLKEDELLPSDIMVIHCDPLQTRQAVGYPRQKLFQMGIPSHLAGVTTSPDEFFDKNSVIFTSIFRAKGNEAAMVYVIDSQLCQSGRELARKRNILFTALTRSKGWVRILGAGESCGTLQQEYEKVKQNDFRLQFRYPTEAERKQMNVVNRDMTDEEKKAIKKRQTMVKTLVADLESGDFTVDDLSPDILEKLARYIKK
ncbi:DEAD/DEAH box helicase [Bdellovibrio sp. HCB2-146]|uniref:DEAD/DEAH box helicase n=1 Tax=Bdellovibrio sp. HCB2-146 TaxID=3394362 RepID=UPI0039BC74D8